MVPRTRAQDQGRAAAQFNLGALYESGTGVAQDVDDAELAELLSTRLEADGASVTLTRVPDGDAASLWIDGAREVAIEFRSFSKSVGFTGTRCAYTVVPKTCLAYTKAGEPIPVHTLWNRRHTTKFNSVSYPVQRAAEAVYTPQGKAQVRELIAYYLANASYIRKQMEALGYTCIGGENSPYIWIDGKTDSWAFFDQLLNKAEVVCTPGAGFGKCGEGYIRISAFNAEKHLQNTVPFHHRRFVQNHHGIGIRQGGKGEKHQPQRGYTTPRRLSFA